MISGILEALTASDLKLMRRIHHWQAPRWIRIWMVATRGGDGWIWCAMGAVILAFGGPQRFIAVSAALLVAVAGVAVFLCLKKRIGRRRRARAALLGEAVASRSVLVSVGPHDHGLWVCTSLTDVLAGAAIGRFTAFLVTSAMAALTGA
jgi:hypothetical protein